MEKKVIDKVQYRLAASQRGGKLTIDPWLFEQMKAEMKQAANVASLSDRRPDQRAFAECVEWERLGDFAQRGGSVFDAIRAYREAALSCLDGDYYDHGRHAFPSRFLRLRFFSVLDKAMALCANEHQFARLILDDPLLRRHYRRMHPVE